MKISLPVKTSLSDTVWYILAVSVFITLVAIAGYAFVQQQKTFLLNEKHKEISTIADLKTSQLVQWRKVRFAEGAAIRENAMMARRINDYIVGKDKDAVRRELRHWMTTLIDLGGYSKGMLFNTKGEVIASDSELIVPPSQHYLDHVAKAVQEQELILSDFHTDYAGAPYELDLTIPIMFSDGKRSRCIAVLTLDIDPDKRLNALIQTWPTNSPTAETLLVKREGDSVVFLNQLRFRKKTSTPFLLPLTGQRTPAVMAVLGHEGSFDALDYRNIAVISATRVIPGTQWGLVAKIDRSEVMAPLSKIIWYVAAATIILSISMILRVFLWKTQRKLRREIVERQQLEQQLLNAKRLEAIGQIAGGVAHEVRNPLNAILTITEALFKEKEIASNPEYEPFILHIRTQVNRLVHLMNDLLDLGRTIPETNLQPMPLYDVCREALDLWKSTGTAKNRRGILTSDSDDISMQVLADGLKLQQVFFNLLENAGHHTPDSSIIRMQLTHNGHGLTAGTAVVQVIDQGTGVAKNKLSHVFDPFYTDRKGGTGLGLALVKHFIGNMGGTVQIWNNNPPPGCTVEVRIPLYRGESQ